MGLLQEYVDLKYNYVSILEKSPNKIQIINNTLNRYSGLIKSRRATERVASGLNLIKLLEKRDILSYYNVDVLFHIEEQLGRVSEESPQRLKIHEYRQRLVSDQLPTQPNYYSCTKKPITEQHIDNNVNNTNCDDVEILVYEAISETIGASWKTLARYLSVKESIIDNLEKEYGTNTMTIIQEILKIYRRRYPKSWIPDVCKALEKSRRSDIKQTIEEILRNRAL